MTSRPARLRLGLPLALSGWLAKWALTETGAFVGSDLFKIPPLFVSRIQCVPCFSAESEEGPSNIMAKSYSEKLRDPRWQKKRLKVMERDGFLCTHCKIDGDTLNVHHSYYRSGRDPWDYPDESLITVCEKCHAKIEAMRVRFGIETASSVKRCALFHELLCSEKLVSLVSELDDWNDALMRIRSESAKGLDVADLRHSTLGLVRLLMGTLDAAEAKSLEQGLELE